MWEVSEPLLRIGMLRRFVKVANIDGFTLFGSEAELSDVVRRNFWRRFGILKRFDMVAKVEREGASVEGEDGVCLAIGAFGSMEAGRAEGFNVGIGCDQSGVRGRVEASG